MDFPKMQGSILACTGTVTLVVLELAVPVVVAMARHQIRQGIMLLLAVECDKAGSAGLLGTTIGSFRLSKRDG